MATTTPIAAPDLRPSAVSASRLRLVLFAGISALTLGLGGWLTSMGFGPWYDELQKPAFQPPGWVFGPVWTTILTLLAVAMWQVTRRSESNGPILRLYAIQIALNLAWSLLFFTLGRPLWALADIAVLDIVVVALALRCGRIHRPSGWMLAPYAVWLGLATAINVWIVAHNG